MTAIVARALGSGFRETFFMGLGLVLGDLVYLTGVIMGLAFVAQTFTTTFMVIKILGALYLVYIAYKLWTAGLLPQFINPALGDVFSQSIVFGMIQIATSVLVNALIVLTAGSIATFLAGRPAWLSMQRWLMGGVLGALALRMAMESRR
jgi:threonine/homoserine/homoserine lactone efflux protein